MKSLVVALLLLGLVNTWLWRRVRRHRWALVALLAGDLALLGLAAVAGGDAVLAVLGVAFLVAVAPVIVRELGNHEHPEVLNPDRIHRFRSGS